MIVADMVADKPPIHTYHLAFMNGSRHCQTWDARLLGKRLFGKAWNTMNTVTRNQVRVKSIPLGQENSRLVAWFDCDYLSGVADFALVMRMHRLRFEPFEV